MIFSEKDLISSSKIYTMVFVKIEKIVILCYLNVSNKFW